MRRYIDYESGRKVYVGPYLDPGVTSEELRDHFGKYGSIQAVWVARNPPGFAFVTFDDVKDAESACRFLNDTEFCGKRIRVEIAHGPRNNRVSDRMKKRKRSRSYSPCYRKSPSYGGAYPSDKHHSRNSHYGHSKGRYPSRDHSPPYKSRNESSNRRPVHMSYDKHDRYSNSNERNDYSTKRNRYSNRKIRRSSYDNKQRNYSSYNGDGNSSCNGDNYSSNEHGRRYSRQEDPRQRGSSSSVDKSSRNYDCRKFGRKGSNRSPAHIDSDDMGKKSISYHKNEQPTHSSVSSSNGYPVDPSYSGERM